VFWKDETRGDSINICVIIGLAGLYSAFNVIYAYTFALLPAFLIWDL
jgi:hypothetical protein